MENLLLSADGDISLYQIKKELWEKLNDLCEVFDQCNKKACYDEVDFVKFVKQKYGNDSIEFVKVVGQCNAGEFNEDLDRFEDLIQDEYKDSRRINF